MSTPSTSTSNETSTFLPYVTLSPADCHLPPQADRVARHLGRWFEVHLSDGRIVRGLLVATDKQANFILKHTVERWTPDEEPRFIGLAMVAKRHVKTIFLIRDDNVEESSSEKVG